LTAYNATKTKLVKLGQQYDFDELHFWKEKNAYFWELFLLHMKKALTSMKPGLKSSAKQEK
jgi:hypothetical protein